MTDKERLELAEDIISFHLARLEGEAKSGNLRSYVELNKCKRFFELPEVPCPNPISWRE